MNKSQNDVKNDDSTKNDDESSSSALGNLSSMAAMAGVNLGSSGGISYSELAKYLVNSNTIQDSVIEKFNFIEEWEIENRLAEVGFPYEYKHIAYEYMSHALLTKLPIIYKMAFKSERANAKACAVDRENMKKELLFWIHNVWQ